MRRPKPLIQCAAAAGGGAAGGGGGGAWPCRARRLTGSAGTWMPRFGKEATGVFVVSQLGFALSPAPRKNKA